MHQPHVNPASPVKNLISRPRAYFVGSKYHKNIYNFRKNCLSIGVQIYLRYVHKELKECILKAANRKQDDLSDQLFRRVINVSDSVAADVIHHDTCSNSYFPNECVK